MGEAAASSPTVEVVGNAFVLQYYRVLHQCPQHVHRFYQDHSKMGRPSRDGAMDLTTTLEAIKEKILSLDYGEFRAEIKTVDAQESFGGGVLVLVNGYLTGKDEVTRNFTQVFFLAPQEIGYFVLNDVFRFAEDVKSQQGAAHVPVNEIENPVKDTPAEETPSVEEETSEESLVSVVCSESPDVTPEEPIANETNKNVQSTPESINTAKEVLKKSYACMLKVPAVAPLATSAPAAATDIFTTVAKQMNTMAAPAAPAIAPALNKDTIENGHQHGEGHSVYIKALPLNATPTQIEAEFKQFGPIKRDGVQIRSSKGFCFGFVEFEEASAAFKAIKASPIIISGHEVFIQEKKSTHSRYCNFKWCWISCAVNNEQRYPAGRRNGFKNEEGRGRGSNGGGRGGYDRAGFNSSNHTGKGNSEPGFHNRGTPSRYKIYDCSNDRHPSGMMTNKRIIPRNPAAA